MTKSPSGTELGAIRRFVRTHGTLVLSTSDGSGQSSAAPLFYLAGPDLELYWFSSSSSRHSVNIARDPRGFIVIYHPTERWHEIRGVQMQGTVQKIVDRSQRREIVKAYRDKFELPESFRVVIARSSLYVFRPSWMRYLDNAKRFGSKLEFSVA